MTFKDFLISINACEESRIWVGDKSIQEAWETCERGDWLLWWYARADNYDRRKITLAAGHIANTVRHLMTDDRSIKCVDVCIAYGEGLATDEELATAEATARAAEAAWDAEATARAAEAAWDAEAARAAEAAGAAATARAARAAWAAATARAAWDAAGAARAAWDANLKETADLCRKYLPMPIHSKVNQ